MTSLIVSLRSRFQARSFLTNVAMLASATAGAQGLFILASPILTRLYTRQDFGILALYTSITSIAVVAASGRFEMAIPLPEEDEEAANLLAVALSILLVSTIALLAIVLLFGDALARAIHAPQLRPYLLLFPVSLLLLGIYQVLSYRAIRSKEFSILSRTKLAQGFWQVSVQLCAGFMKANPLGLILGDIAGRSGGTGTLARLIWQQYGDSLRKVTWGGMKAAAYRYRSFPRLSTGQALLTTANQNLAPVVLAAYYNPTTVGLFALSQRVVGIPSSLIGMAVSQVFMGESAATAKKSPHELKTLLWKTSGRLFALGLLPAATLLLAGPALFAFVFGQAWHEAGVFAAIMAPNALFEFAVSPISVLLVIQERLGWLLAWDAVRFCTAIGGLITFSSLGFPIKASLTFYTLSMLVMYIVLFTLALKSIQGIACE